MTNEKSMRDIYKELTREQKKKNNKRFLKYVFEKKGHLFLIVFTTLLIIAEGAAVPKLTQLIIDEWLPKIPGNPISDDSLKLLIGVLCAMFGLIIVKTTSIFISTYIVRKFQQDLEMQLKRELFNKIQKLDVSYFDKYNEGYLISRMSRDTTMAAEYARYIPENIVNFLFAFSINFSFIFIYSWILGISSMVILVIIMAYTSYKRKHFINSWNHVKQHGDIFNQFLANSFSGVKETKSYVQEKEQTKKYDEISEKYKAAWRKNFLLYGQWMTINTGLLMLLPLNVLAIGSWQVIEGNISIGALTALTLYTSQIINPINKFLAVFDLFMRGAVSLNRIFQLLDEKEEAYEGKELNVTNGEIEFKNVELQYNEEYHALRGISFKIKPGEKVAFVGHTGSGKSTILKAIMNFYKPTKGQILIDNQNIFKVSVISLRENITLMSQDPYIFFDTLKSNIAFGAKNFTHEKYKEAIYKSQSEEFVNELPSKDETNIGPRGVTLSGGQKQRVALARAILKNSKIILFDEATSALDNNTESEVKKQIDKLMSDNTIIYVAHRLTTIKNVDRIFVLEKGKIAEVGSHKELIKKKGKYYELVAASGI